MWELIAANRRKSIFLVTGMALSLVVMGYFIGEAFLPGQGGMTGVLIATILWVILTLVSFMYGDSIILSMSSAHEIDYQAHPQLYNIVEEMKIASNLPVMPRIYIVDEATPNAFATGIWKDQYAVAVTAGLLQRLNRDELQGVIAHEMSHIGNRDVLFMTFASVVLGSIQIISQIFLRGSRFNDGLGRFRSKESKDARAQLIIFAVAIVFAIVGPILVRILYFSLSRQREYLADASGARLTRYPEGLASALEKISSGQSGMQTASSATAPMYIANPLKANQSEESFFSLFDTHPPIQKRVAILRAMSQGADFLSYQKAYESVTGKSNHLIPASALKNSEVVGIRTASTEDKNTTLGKKDSRRDFGDLIRLVNQFAFLSCTCGLKIKIPPDFKESKITCPSCGSLVEIPKIQDSQNQVIGSDQTLEYHRKVAGYESFVCACGKTITISPAFVGEFLTCAACARKIKIFKEN